MLENSRTVNTAKAVLLRPSYRILLKYFFATFILNNNYKGKPDQSHFFRTEP